MKQTKQFLRPLLMAIVMMVGMLVPQGAWAQELWVDYGETVTISEDASYDGIDVDSGGELIINEGVTLTVTVWLNINGYDIDNFGTVINYGTIIGEGQINMQGGVLANHGHINVDVRGNGTFYNTGTHGDGYFNLTPTDCYHDDSENLGTVEATCTHGAGTQFKCNTCYYIGIKETGEPSPHDNYDHNGLTVCSTCGQLTYDAPTVGEGTAESPYQIANAGHLFWLADKVNNDYDNFKDANAVLTADIVVNDGTFADDGTFTATGASESSTPIEWLIIGRFDLSSYGYRGTFDGQGHTISGLYANYIYSGFVGMSAGEGKIKNVGVINSYFDGIRAGGICGRPFDNAEISNCYSNNVICNGSYVGGIVGGSSSSGVSIINCYSTASLINQDGYENQTGGIAGTMNGSTTNCYTSYGNVNGWSGTEPVNCEANVSLERFASGEIAYKLNGSKTDGTQAWYQKIGTDAAPVLINNGSNNVYEVDLLTCSGEAGKTFANANEAITQPHDYHVLLDEDNTPVFVWSEDYTTATLQVVCSHNAEHTANVEVTGEGITSEDTTPATCTTAGVRTYTAKATYEGVEYTGTKEVEIPATGHSFTSKTLTAEKDANGLYAYVCDREGCGGHGDYNVVKRGEGESTTTIELTPTTEGGTTTYTAASVEVADGKAFETPVAFTVTADQVTVNRTFTADKPASQMLPFTVPASQISGATFYEFGGVSFNETTRKWEAKMTAVTTGNLEAYKPYLVVPTTASITFNNGTSPQAVTFVKTSEASGNMSQTGTSGTATEGWTFKAVNTTKTWSAGDEELGRAYGFAAAGHDGFEAGQFVKVGEGASAAPGRCYLMKDNSNPLTRAGEELPATIGIRFVVGSTTGIGTLDTETGAFTFDGWYDLQGNRVSEPKQGGVMIKDNKKVMVK